MHRFATESLFELSAGASLRLDLSSADDLTPLFGLVSDELAEIGRRAGQGGSSHAREARLQCGIREALVHRGIEPVDDLWRRMARHAEPEPVADVIAGHEIAHDRRIRNKRRSWRRRHGERAQPVRLDMLYR